MKIGGKQLVARHAKFQIPVDLFHCGPSQATGTTTIGGMKWRRIPL
jgi:hypothetical protein